MSIKYKDKNMQQSYDICYMVSENFIKSANELYANSNIVVISQPDTVLVKKKSYHPSKPSQKILPLKSIPIL